MRILLRNPIVPIATIVAISAVVVCAGCLQARCVGHDDGGLFHATSGLDLVRNTTAAPYAAGIALVAMLAAVLFVSRSAATGVPSGMSAPAPLRV